MSWRNISSQPLAAKINAPTNRKTKKRELRNKFEALIILHLRHMLRMHALQKFRAFREMKLRVVRLDAQIKTIIRSAGEASHAEDGVMRLRQLIERQHAKHRKNGSSKNRQFECDGDKCRPAIQGPSADVNRVGHCVDPKLKEETSQAAAESTKKRQVRNTGPLQPHRFRKSFHWKWRVRIKAAKSRFTSFSDGVEQLLRRLKLTHHTVNVRALLVHSLSSDVCATSSRISAMEIAGRTRTNRNINVVKSPNVPANVAQSQTVGW